MFPSGSVVLFPRENSKIEFHQRDTENSRAEISNQSVETLFKSYGKGRNDRRANRLRDTSAKHSPVNSHLPISLSISLQKYVEEPVGTRSDRIANI